MEKEKLRGPSASVRCASPRNILQALALMLLMLLVNVGALSAQQTSVSYLSPVFLIAETDTVGIEDWNTLTCTDYTVVTTSEYGTTVTWGADGTDSWYVVNANCSIYNVRCLGNVHLILVNGCTLDVSHGISNNGDSFTIYAQDTTKNTMGVLNVQNEYSVAINASSSHRFTINGGRVTVTGGHNAAGIGGKNGEDGSYITINGGYVTATAGSKTTSYFGAAAGIGGGRAGSGYHITINGGNVTATGNEGGSGIGGGYQGAGSYITINGGNVTANGSGYALTSGYAGGSGIGGGAHSDGSYITINGGKVTATGSCGGSGIGGGYDGDGSNITIDGGTVSADGGAYGSGAAGIGGGYLGSGSYITINDGNVVADGGPGGIGSGSSGTVASNIFVDGNMNLKYYDTYSGYLTITHTSTDDVATSLAGKHFVQAYLTNPDTISYLSPVYKTLGDTASGIDHWNTLQHTNCNEVTSGQTSWGIAGKKTWYVVKANTTINNNVTCYGNVNLILENGFTLTTNAIIETGGIGNSLTIYAQDTTKSVMGKLNATGGSDNAGIGGGDNANGSNITINGGWITAQGGTNAAGIGGGNIGNGSNITINGGYVTTTGGTSGAGIGGGLTNNSNAGLGSYITINGGNVTATGGSGAAGIGGGYKGNGSHILVNDGYVTANGGDNGAGIGGGNHTTTSGAGGAGSYITIAGGKVKATGGDYGAGIGSGYFGNASTNITITNGDVTATGGTNADGIGNGSMSQQASHIFVADSILLKAGTSTPLTDADVVAHASVTTDIASSLTGKRYAKTEVFADTNYTIYISSGHAYKNSASSANDITNEIASRGLAYIDGIWTMNNFSFTTTAYTALYILDDVSIIVSGTNTITGGDETNRTGSYGLYSYGNLTLSGTGTLNANSGNCYEMNNSTGMHVRGNLTVNGCNVVATAGTTDVDNSISYGMFIGGVFYIGPSARLEGNGDSNTAGFAFSSDHVPTGITVKTNNGGDVYILEEGYSGGIAYCTYLDQSDNNPANHVVITPAAFYENGDWNVASNWSSNSVPAASNAVIINAQCTIPSGCDAVCNDMKINSPLYVAPTASLVATSIDNETATNLFIASDEDGTGTVKFTSGTAPKATVQMYFKGHATDNGDKMVDPEWQYRGFIGTPDEGQSLSNIAIYRWDETKNDSNCWVDRIDPGTSANFIETVGYSMANYTTDVATRSYTTTLLPVDEISYSGMTYTGTVETPNRGVNLITNSMSAPINLSDNGITSENLAESTVYLFKTRSYNSWKSDESAAITTYPLYSGSVIADNFIPAGQSFAVKANANGNASLTFPASAIASDNSGAMYAPREESEFGILAITAESEDGVDDLFLLESDICDAKFNNGYDGTKMFASNAPQIYATNDYGMTAVNADNTLLGQYIGVRQGSTSNSITMTISRRDLDNYTSLSLYDCVSGTYYDLADDETTITITATGDQPRRFLISGKRDDGTLYTPTESGSLVVAGDQLMLVNFGRSDAQIMLTDASGKMLWSENSKNGNTFTLPQLPAGVYFISCGKVSTKYITK